MSRLGVRRFLEARRSQLEDQAKMAPKNSPAKESFTWSTEIPRPENEWICSGLYESEILENCKLKFGIKSRIIEGITHLDIKISKTNHEAVRARVNVCLVHHEIQQIQFANSWTKIFQMKRFSMACFCDYDETYDIFFEITWLNSGCSLEEPEPPNLYNDVGKFLADPTFSDVTIVIENEEIKAHKIILCGCSSVFYDMFTNPMKESQENRVEIPDVKIDTMNIVLMFLYTGNYEALDDVDAALDTLAFAQKYNMVKLKEICEYKLSNSITLENVLKILNEADYHSAMDLQQECLDFMNQNRELLKTVPELETLCMEKPVLMYKFMINLL